MKVCACCGCHIFGTRSSDVRPVNAMELFSNVVLNCIPFQGAYTGMLDICRKANKDNTRVDLCSPCQLVMNRVALKGSVKRRCDAYGRCYLPIDELLQWIMDPSSKMPDIRIVKRLLASIARSLALGIGHLYLHDNGGPVHQIVIAASTALAFSQAHPTSPISSIQSLIDNEALKIALHGAWMKYNGDPLIVNSLFASKMNRRYTLQKKHSITQKKTGVVVTHATTYTSNTETQRLKLLAISSADTTHFRFSWAA
jgi:hypothetical protein